jgi:hypothetical protein
VRAGYSIRLHSTDNRRQSPALEFFSDEASPPRRFPSATPGEKARRLAALRAALADAAPLFRARIQRAQEEGRS